MFPRAQDALGRLRPRRGGEGRENPVYDEVGDHHGAVFEAPEVRGSGERPRERDEHDRAVLTEPPCYGECLTLRPVAGSEIGSVHFPSARSGTRIDRPANGHEREQGRASENDQLPFEPFWYRKSFRALALAGSRSKRRPRLSRIPEQALADASRHVR